MKYTIDTENKTITLLTECNIHELFVVTDTIPNIKEWTLIPSVIENKLVISNWQYGLTSPFIGTSDPTRQTRIFF